ncbi:MAG: MOSC N-terminal beta barrel domain-containing protein [Rhodoglobus sp.]
MKVAEIWRYPVKSLQGEQLDSAVVGKKGIEGDRGYAIFDLESGFGLTGRREAALLFGAARLVPGGVEITLPDGTIAADDAALSNWLGRPVALRSNADVAERRYQTPEDFEQEETSQWEAFDGARGSFRDSQGAVVSLVSTGTLGSWNPRRFRANVVLDGSGENDLIGTHVSVGTARLGILKGLGRCVMVTRPQPGIERDLDVLRTVHREHDHKLAVGASIERTGRIAVGDELRSGLS